MRLLTSLLLLLVISRPALAQGRFANATTIGRVDSVESAVLGETRPYLVYTPPSYRDTTTAPQRYPVLYLLDGDAHFHSVTGLIQILGTGVNGTFVIPEMIVVAIPNTDRTRDLTPTHTQAGPDGTQNPGFGTSGGMPKFLDFIGKELIPRIESQYRTMPYRVFVGHSLGGITAIDALYEIPQTFDAYVAIDPSLWWDDRVLLRRAKTYFETAKLNGKTLYVAQANTLNAGDTSRNVHFESIMQFNAIMQSYDRSGIRYGYRYYDHDDHGSVPMIAEYDALRFIFDGYKLPLLQVLDHPDLLTEHFRAVSERLGATFTPSEGMVRMLAQIELPRDTANAIQLGEIRARLYPDSYRALEFLGDVWAARDDRARARTYYEQALTKSAGNTAIREKIRKLGN
jgi:predicted alpha/beta superfamily hydrolase